MYYALRYVMLFMPLLQTCRPITLPPSTVGISNEYLHLLRKFSSCLLGRRRD